jgi:hypothetical protein
MPLTYRVACAECGQTTVTTCCYGAIVQDDRSLAVLPHPIEDCELRRLGLSWHAAGWQGRYVVTRVSLCRNCGGLYEHRTMLFPCDPGLGFPPGVPGMAVIVVAVFVGTAVVMLFATDSVWLTFLGSALAVVASLAGWQRLLTCWSRRRARRANREVGDQSCCDTPELISLDRAPGHVFPCQRCGKNAVAVTCVGMS